MRRYRAQMQGETYFRHRGGKCRKAQGVLMQGDGASSIDRGEALEISTKAPVPQVRGQEKSSWVKKNNHMLL